MFRTRQDVSVWRMNLNTAESTINPNRTELLRGYKDVVLDPHVTSVTETRLAMTLGKRVLIKDKDGEINDEWTEKFNRSNMLKIYRWILESVFYGHSLIQLGNIEDDIFTESSLVPREYVKPEAGIWTEHPAAITGQSFREGLYKNWTLEAGDPYYNFGLLNQLTPFWIIKKNNVNGWAIYSERFGEPTVVLKTDVVDQNKRDSARDNLLDSGPGSVSVLDLDEMLEFIEANTGTGYNTFKDLAKFTDDQISKAVLGVTMLTDDGSSRSQAEVHKQIAESRGKQDIQLLETVINDRLIKQMRALGVAIPEGYKAEVDNKEEITPEVRFTRVVELEKVGIEVDLEHIEETFQIPITGRKSQGAADPLGK